MKVKCKLDISQDNRGNETLVICYRFPYELFGSEVVIFSSNEFLGGGFYMEIEKFINNNPKDEIEKMVRKDIEMCKAYNSKLRKRKDIIKKLKEIKFEIDV